MAGTVRTVHVGQHHFEVLEAGVGGVPLLMVHGFTGAKEDFGPAVEPLADAGYWVVAPDLRGHGGSHAPAAEDDYSLRHFADDLHALVAALGWERFDLLGHSMGGMIAQVVAIDLHGAGTDSAGAASPMVHRLVLMDTCHGPVEGLDLGIIELGVEIARSQGLGALLEVTKAFGPVFDSQAHAELLARDPDFEAFEDSKFLASSAAMWSKMAVELYDPEDRLDALSAIDVDTLVIVGDEDARFIGPSERIAAAMPQATLAVVPRAGHSPQFDHPEAWWDALYGFLGAAVPVA
ncbi:MAG: alpha/beta fold hydrolase [Actinomycetes bacterium]